jgi:perosamine synthetase
VVRPMSIDLSRSELAVNGGEPIRSDPWADNFTIGDEEKQAVLRVLDSGYLSKFEGSHTPDPPFSFYGGPEVQQLEAEWCTYYSSKHAISVNSATSGLYAAIGALDIGYGDEVIVSPYTMTACAMAPLIFGAIPIFADVDEITGSMTRDSIQQVITNRTKAILIVHQFGMVADIESIKELARTHNLRLIEDCAQAHGAKYNDQFVGLFGDIGVFSLNVNKSIQTGEGGICITEDDEIAYRLSLIRNHGEAVVGPAEYHRITNIVGFNFRLTEIQAAIAREQLKKLEQLNAHRLHLVRVLTEGLSKYPFLEPPKKRVGVDDTFYVYPLLFNEEVARVSRQQFAEALNAEGAQFYQGYVQPLYLQPIYQRKNLFNHGYPFCAPPNKGHSGSYEKGLCKNAENLYEKRMLINEHIRPPHTIEDVEQLIQIVSKVSA